MFLKNLTRTKQKFQILHITILFQIWILSINAALTNLRQKTNKPPMFGSDMSESDSDTIQPDHVEFIEDLEDFQKYHWIGSPMLKYAEKQENLTKALQAKINITGISDGIFYFEGKSRVANQAIFKKLHFTPEFYQQEIQNCSLYIRYYIHNLAGNIKMRMAYVGPVVNPSVAEIKFLPVQSNGDEWADGVFQVKIPEDVNEFSLELGIINFKEGDHFLVDRIALIFGQKMNLEEIREHFGVSVSGSENDLGPPQYGDGDTYNRRYNNSLIPFEVTLIIGTLILAVMAISLTTIHLCNTIFRKQNSLKNIKDDNSCDRQ